jgi:ribosomal protein L29
MANKNIDKKNAQTKKGAVKELLLSDMNAMELKKMASELRLKIVNLNLEKNAGKLRNVREIFNTRKQLARVLTQLMVKSAN